MKLKLCALVFLATTCFATLAEARLGESLEQCLERYGPVIERRISTLGASDPEACVFSKSGVTIIIEFHEGTAWHISYRKVKMLANESESLVMANSTKGPWSSPLKLSIGECRLSSDRSRVAILEDIPGTKAGLAVTELRVMTREWLAENRASYLKRSDAPLSAPERPTVNPLPGF